MLKDITRLLILLVLVVAGGFAVWLYYDHYSTAQRLRKLEEEKKQLEQFVVRLTAERRVAEILITDQKTENGVLVTTLLFVEYGRNQTPLPARSFTVRGDNVHVDAMVIKFDRDFIKQDDPLRGHSLALFTRIYGENEKPAEAEKIDPPNQIPPVYRPQDPRIPEFETKLWKNFWRLTEDPDYRTQMGVRIANGQGVWGPFKPDRLYTLTLESDGGLNLTSEPVRSIYLEAIKKRNRQVP